MNPSEAERKAFQKTQDFARETDRPEVFWEELFEDIQRKKRLIDLDRVKRSFE